MDLRGYYSNLREIEAGIQEDPTVVISVKTADGGAAGRKTQVTRRIAAVLIAEGRARAASKEEAEQYHREMEQARRAIEDAEYRLQEKWLRRSADAGRVPSGGKK